MLHAGVEPKNRMTSQAGAAASHGPSTLVYSTVQVKRKPVFSKGRFEFVKTP